MLKTNNHAGRTAALTIDDLMASKRFAFAVEFIKEDPMMMKAILVEFAQEASRVQRTAMVNLYSTHNDLDFIELRPLLKSCTQGSSWNIYWGLDPVEQQLYAIDPKCQKSHQERVILIEQLRIKYMESNLNPEVEDN